MGNAQYSKGGGVSGRGSGVHGFAFENEPIKIEPQSGPQIDFLSTRADIAIYGGAAGGGKTWSLLLDPLRHVNNPLFRGVIFRRTFPQITNPGGLWDESLKLYKYAGGKETTSKLLWRFASGAEIVFKHMQYESDKDEFQGAQIPFIGFDELTHFTRTMFFYMLSRNRSVSGIAPYMRGSCNPDANSWVKVFLGPWLDRTFIQPWGEKRRLNSAELGYFSGVDGVFRWHSPEQYLHEIRNEAPQDRVIKTVTFIKASVYDNKELLRVNPQYLGNLKSLPLVEQERFLHGNWDIVETGNMFRLDWFPIIGPHQVPKRFKRVIRFWDFASTKPGEVERGQKEDDPDYTVGVLLALAADGAYYFLDMISVRDTPQAIEELVYNTACADTEKYGRRYEVWWEQEGGSSGEFVTQTFKKMLKGFQSEGLSSSGSKLSRAKPVSAECQKKNVHMLSAEWNDVFFSFATAFPNKDVHDDVVDALSGAYNVHLLPPETLRYRPVAVGVSGWGRPETAVGERPVIEYYGNTY